MIEDTYRRYGKEIYLGLTGESLGAATEITALRYHPDVRFIVNDCGYADLIPVEKDGLKGMHLPQWLVSGLYIWRIFRAGSSITSPLREEDRSTA